MHITQSGKGKKQYNGFKIFFAIIWTQYTILPFALQLYRLLPFIGFTYQYIKPVLICFTLFLTVKYIGKKVKIIDVVFYGVCVIIVCSHCILYSNNAETIYDVVWSFLGIVVPFYFVGLAYNDDELKDILHWSSLIGCIFVVSYQFYQIGIGRELPKDNMGTAYNILPSVLVLINQSFETRKWRDILISILALISIFLFGTRGPILVCLIYVVTRIFFCVFNKPSLKNVSFFIATFIFVAFISSPEQMINIAQYLSLKFSQIGFSTRVFDMFIDGEISNSSGRNIFYTKVIDAIRYGPTWGYGFMGDRQVAGGYVHNIFLELWCHFGIIFGTVMIAFYVFVPIVALIKSRKDSCFGFVLALVVMMFVKLMISGSYVYENYLFFMLGVCVSVIRKNTHGIFKTQIGKSYGRINCKLQDVISNTKDS